MTLLINRKYRFLPKGKLYTKPSSHGGDFIVSRDPRAYDGEFLIFRQGNPDSAFPQARVPHVRVERIVDGIDYDDPKVMDAVSRMSWEIVDPLEDFVYANSLSR